MIMLGEEEDTAVKEGEEGNLDENALYELMSKMYQGLPTITDLTGGEIKNLTKLSFKADVIGQYDKKSQKWYRDMARDYEKLKISLTRKGRREVFNSLMHGNIPEEEPHRRFSFFK